MLICMLTSGILAFAARSTVDINHRRVEEPKEIPQRMAHPSNTGTISNQDAESNRQWIFIFTIAHLTN